MVELLKEIDDVNARILSLMETDILNHEDNFTKEIAHFLNLRETLFANVRKAETVEEKKLGEKIMLDNELINEALKQKTLQLKKEINQFNQKKKNNQFYDNPFQNTYADGMFLDKKK